MATEDRFTKEWLEEAGLKWRDSDLTDEAKGFALAASTVANLALLDAEAINRTTLEVLNGAYPSETKQGYLHALGVLSEAWATLGSSCAP